MGFIQQEHRALRGQALGPVNPENVMRRIIGMAAAVVIAFVAIFPGGRAGAAPSARVFTLDEAIGFALENNPGVSAGERMVEREGIGVDAARGERLPKVALVGAVTRSRFDQPITPISGNPLTGGSFPDFDETKYDVGVEMTLPLYAGGRLARGVRMAEIREAVARETLEMDRTDLAFNVTSVYHKIGQLKRLVEANGAVVKGLEEHKKDVELFLEAGTAARVDLLKTESELAQARQNLLRVRNDLAGARELLKAIMGMDPAEDIAIADGDESPGSFPSVEEGLEDALSRRHDYRAILRERDLAYEKVRFAGGRRLPSVSLGGEYMDSSGDDLDFRENWAVGVRFSLPIFDGGVIRSEVAGARKEAEMAGERERALRYEISREVKEAYLDYESSTERVEASRAAVRAAREALRIERLKYEAGSGTSADVLDAEAALLRAESGYWQAVFDKRTAGAEIKRATGSPLF